MTEREREVLSAPLVAKGVAPSFELFFRPSVELISVIRRFVVEFYREILADQDAASRLALTTHELLENAAKYSTDGTAVLYVEVDRDAGSVLVRTTNRASVEQIAKLQQWFREVAATADAQTLYAQLIETTAKQASGSGGLGLARIWAETEMALDLTVSGDSVSIHARGALGRDI